MATQQLSGYSLRPGADAFLCRDSACWQTVPFSCLRISTWRSSATGDAQRSSSLSDRRCQRRSRGRYSALNSCRPDEDAGEKVLGQRGGALYPHLGGDWAIISPGAESCPMPAWCGQFLSQFSWGYFLGYRNSVSERTFGESVGWGAVWMPLSRQTFSFYSHGVRCRRRVPGAKSSARR